MTRVAILRFPGTWSDRDFEHALSLAGPPGGINGTEAEILWHEGLDLRGFDAAIVPGGFAYGDYVRAGAIARLSPAIRELRRFAETGAPVLGIALAGDPATGVGGVLPSSWGLGWTLFILSFVFTAVIIVLIAINFPLRMQKLLRPDHVRPADRMDHVDEELAVSRNPDTIVAS